GTCRPLEELFQPVLDVLDALEPFRLVGLAAPHAPNLGEQVASVSGAPAPLTAVDTLLRDSVAAGADGEDDLFGFRPGDLFVPLIDLHRTLMQTFDALADEVLEPAAALLHQRFAGHRASFDPAAIAGRLEAAAVGVPAEVDLT